MARIRGRNTRIEIAVRKALFARGFRYRLHKAGLPGRPDLTFPCHRAVIFLHGCYWHGHGCHLFRLPSGNAEFWRTKISRNIERDERDRASLVATGWRVMTIWECAIRGKRRLDMQEVTEECEHWLFSEAPEASIQGYADAPGQETSGRHDQPST